MLTGVFDSVSLEEDQEDERTEEKIINEGAIQILIPL
jgi:hypothetical protein